MCSPLVWERLYAPHTKHRNASEATKSCSVASFRLAYRRSPKTTYLYREGYLLQSGIARLLQQIGLPKDASRCSGRNSRSVIRRLAGESFDVERCAHLYGSDRIIEGIVDQRPPAEICAEWEPGEAAFMEKRAGYLIYE